MRGCQERNRSPATRRFGGGLREPRGVCVGGQALGRRRWRPGPPARPWLPGSGSLPRSVLPCLSPKVEATPARRGRSYTCCAGSWAPDIAEAVGVSSRRPDPVGIPLRPPGVPPSAASAPAPPPRPCVRSRLSLAHSQPPTLCPPWHPPKSVSVCLSGSPLKPVAGVCVCVRGRRETACLGDCLPLPAWPPPTSRHPPPRPHSQIQADTHIYTHAYTHHLTSLGFP